MILHLDKRGSDLPTPSPAMLDWHNNHGPKGPQFGHLQRLLTASDRLIKPSAPKELQDSARGFNPEQTPRIRTLKGCKIEWPTNR
jgi:hypothetical protein